MPAFGTPDHGNRRSVSADKEAEAGNRVRRRRGFDIGDQPNIPNDCQDAGADAVRGSPAYRQCAQSQCKKREQEGNRRIGASRCEGGERLPRSHIRFALKTDVAHQFAVGQSVECRIRPMSWIGLRSRETNSQPSEAHSIEMIAAPGHDALSLLEQKVVSTPG